MQNLNFHNRFLSELPGDAEVGPRRRQVLRAAWSRVQPTPVPAPRVLIYAREVAELLGLTATDLESPVFARVFSGNQLLPGMDPYAVAYGGHQFGNWAGQLGDGRAINFGEVVGPSGARFEVQLKGAGPTPYSRTADGRAVLRSSIREFLCSEAMHHLGVPTTRALCLVQTGAEVVRDMFYDGHPRAEPGAIVCRVAPSFLRFGNYELPQSRGDHTLLQRLVDFTIDRDFPEIDADRADRRALWFAEVCRRTARLMAHWMRVGFVHGVMNTDNMSIMGLTLDYGPYGWIDNYDLNWTPNTTDADRRRYRFGQQPQVAHWNLVRLAEALSPLFENAEPLEQGLELYAAVFNTEYRNTLQAKFGFEQRHEQDTELIEQALDLLGRAELDMTLFFRGLSQVDLALPSLTPLEPAFYNAELQREYAPRFTDWLERYTARARQDPNPTLRRARMNAVNPRYVLRNYLAQQAIDAATAGDLAPLHGLLELLRRPYDDQPEHAHYAAKRPDWARVKAGCSMLSCSS